MAAGIIMVLFFALHGCGGGGGGGGGPSGPTTSTTKLYLFGTLSSNRNIASVQTSIAVSGFTSYSAPVGAVAGVYPLRRGVFSPSGPVIVSSSNASYDISQQKINISLINGTFKNMSSSTLRNGGMGTEIGTLIMPAAVSFSSGTVDYNPSVGQFRLSPPEIKSLAGCKVNYAP